MSESNFNSQGLTTVGSLLQNEVGLQIFFFVFDVLTFTNALHLTKVTNSNIFSLFEFLITEIIGTVGLYFYIFPNCMLLSVSLAQS